MGKPAVFIDASENRKLPNFWHEFLSMTGDNPYKPPIRSEQADHQQDAVLVMTSVLKWGKLAYQLSELPRQPYSRQAFDAILQSVDHKDDMYLRLDLHGAVASEGLELKEAFGVNGLRQFEWKFFKECTTSQHSDAATWFYQTFIFVLHREPFFCAEILDNCENYLKIHTGLQWDILDAIKAAGVKCVLPKLKRFKPYSSSNELSLTQLPAYRPSVNGVQGNRFLPASNEAPTVVSRSHVQTLRSQIS